MNPHRLLISLIACASLAVPALAADTVTLAMTPTLDQAGVRSVLASFTRATSVEVRIVVGNALDLARRGDADAALSDDRESQQRFMDEGWGIERVAVVRSDLILAGLRNDPVHANGATLDAALQSLARSKPAFVSCTERMGSCAPELRAWAHAGVDFVKLRGSWVKTAPNAPAALAAAVTANAYVLIDRATWLTSKRGSLVAMSQGEPELATEYGALVVNPAKYPRVKAQAAHQLVEWLTSPAAQQALGELRIEGQAPFMPAR